jgi:hypothetical protein
MAVARSSYRRAAGWRDSVSSRVSRVQSSSVFVLPCLFASRFAARFALAMSLRCSLAPPFPPNRVEADLPPGSKHYRIESVSGRVGAGGMETDPHNILVRAGLRNLYHRDG